MGRNVLGQYELALLDPERPPRLLLVAPNLREGRPRLRGRRGRAARVGRSSTRTTHAVQFTGVPVAARAPGALLRELLSSVKVEVDPAALLRLPKMQDLRAAWDSVRKRRPRARGGRARAQGDHRPPQASWRSSRATPSTSWTRPAPTCLPSLPKLRESLERRRRDKPPLVKLLERLLGLDLKMRQYLVGKRFCDAVVRDWGIEGLNRAWSAPEHLPDARRARRSGRLGP
jgi:uncharacterized protein (DUF2342 family)